MDPRDEKGTELALKSLFENAPTPGRGPVGKLRSRLRIRRSRAPQPAVWKRFQTGFKSLTLGRIEAGQGLVSECSGRAGVGRPITGHAWFGYETSPSSGS